MRTITQDILSKSFPAYQQKSAKQKGAPFFLKLCSLFILSLGLLAANGALAQGILLGLTSTGGPQGGGTAFTLKTTGTDFTVRRAFGYSPASPSASLVKATDGNFYGMTQSGGTNNYGTIFKMTPTGTLTVLKNLDYTTTGGNPKGNLVQGSDGNFYGMTYVGGTNYYGTIFKITLTGTLTVLKHLDNTNTGGNSNGSLIKATDGNFYGMTTYGGTNNYGTIFKITPTGTLTVLKHLNSTTQGAYPLGSLVQGSDGNFYGMTQQGGVNGYGIIFKMTSTGTLTVLKHLDYTNTGGFPSGSLIKATDGNFYGLTQYGGTGGVGAIFKMTPTGTLTVLKNLDNTTQGAYPLGSLVQGSDGNFYGTTKQGGTYSSGTLFKMTPTSTLSVLKHLDNTTTGGFPYGSLIQHSDGNFYGMAPQGGNGNMGTIFKVTPTGTFSLLAQFPEASKVQSPLGSLIQGTDGTFYGMASQGGTYGYGSIYKLCNGTYSTLRSFNGTTTGGNPRGSLVQGSDGNFYGMTQYGGTNYYGTIFKMTPTGTLTVLKHLDNTTTGGYPTGSLVQGSDGTFYGMTSQGGTIGNGTLFKITPTGTLTVLKHLDNTTGGYPMGSLLQNSDGNFYGVTSQGGTIGNGTIFKMTPTGTLTVLKHLDYSTTGGNPYGNLIKATDGNFYGMTQIGGTNYYGTIFKMTPTGTLTVLKHLDNTTTGGYPTGSLVQGSDGTFYGMTKQGGTYNNGTIFKLTLAGTFTVLKQLDNATTGGNPHGSLILQKANPKANSQTITTAEDTPKALTLSGTGGVPLTYTLVSAPKNGTLSGTGAGRTYVPKANFTGADSFTFTVTWGCQTSLPVTVSITVTSVNDAPVLAAIGNKSVQKGSKLSFTAAATDVDAGQTKTFSLTNAPAGATIGTATGLFSWTPATVGTYTFTVKVADNGSPVRSDSETITVTVTAPATARLAASSEDKQPLKARLYPNPVEHTLTVELQEETSQVAATSVADVQGQVYLNNTHRIKSQRELQIDVARLSKGLYLLRLQTEQGEQILKFIKQ